MTNNLKALVVVLTLAFCVFAIAKPIFMRFMTREAFNFRRNVWVTLTIAGFLSPNAWIYFLIAGPLVIWAGRKDLNPIALYLCLLHIVPPNRYSPPFFGFESFFPIDQYRLLALGVLIPCAVKMLQSGDRADTKPIRIIDALIIAYGLLEIGKLVPYESITNTFRRTFLFFLDVWIVYYVISRFGQRQEKIYEAMATFCLVCAIHAPIAAFEAARTWPLYNGIGGMWGELRQSYVFRSDVLRALSSTGHPLALGYLMALGFGFWLHLRTRVTSPFVSYGVAAWLWLGLLAAYSRAPWLMAGVILFVYLLVGNNGVSRSARALLIGGVAGGFALMSPWGDKIIDNLPFIGTVDSSTVDYRQQLGEVSWRLIKLNPIFGDPFFVKNMEDIREIQGEGIVDLVNTYASIALFHGFTGLLIFVGIFLIAIQKTYLKKKKYTATDVESTSLGANLIGCMAGTLFMMATGSFGTGLAILSWSLVGLMSAYIMTPEIHAVDSRYINIIIGTSATQRGLHSKVDSR